MNIQKYSINNIRDAIIVNAQKLHRVNKHVINKQSLNSMEICFHNLHRKHRIQIQLVVHIAAQIVCTILLFSDHSWRFK